MPHDSSETRKGKGYHWRTSYFDRYGMLKSECSGYSVDNLDTKSIEEAQDTFEKIFIQIRDVMSDMNDNILEDSHLNICHQVARTLSRNFREI